MWLHRKKGDVFEEGQTLIDYAVENFPYDGSQSDYVISTGKQYSVKEFANSTMKELGIKYSWKGSGINEKCFDQFGNLLSRT